MYNRAKTNNDRDPNFYSKLYDKNSYNLDERATDNFLNKVDVKKLSN